MQEERVGVPIGKGGGAGRAFADHTWQHGDPGKSQTKLPLSFYLFYLLFLILRVCPRTTTTVPTRRVGRRPTRTDAPFARSLARSFALNPLNPTHKADLDSDLTVIVLRLKHAASSGPETLLDLCFQPTQRRYGCRPNFVRGGVPTGGGTDARLAR